MLTDVASMAWMIFTYIYLVHVYNFSIYWGVLYEDSSTGGFTNGKIQHRLQQIFDYSISGWKMKNRSTSSKKLLHLISHSFRNLVANGNMLTKGIGMGA
jgi:hypothetical protein